eukprot:COSAG01_NODE_697_length_14188_cov_41.810348_8_plen_112_part_00
MGDDTRLDGSTHGRSRGANVEAGAHCDAAGRAMQAAHPLQAVHSAWGAACVWWRRRAVDPLCRCLCLGLSRHTTRTRPLRFTILQCLHMRLTEARTFMAYGVPRKAVLAAP